MTESSLLLSVIGWLAAVGLLLLVRARTGARGTGLLYTYLLCLGTAHWLGAAIYLLPWVDFWSLAIIEDGFLQSVVAVWAFVLGSLVVAPLLASTRPPRALPPGPRPTSADLPYVYVGASALCYAAVSLGAGAVPSLGGLLASGQQLLVAGCCLLCWNSWVRDDRARLLLILVGTLGLPFFTILTSGFMGYGAVAAMVVLVFVGSVLRPKGRLLAVWVLIAYVGLSFYVTYMQDRGEIREVVWGRRPLGERVEQLFTTLGRFEWFDPTNRLHVWQVDRRLNQNVFVGIATQRFRLGEPFAGGDTILDAFLAVVPRAVWPDKPLAAGSGDQVSRYTGIRFAEGTSVGIGQVMEFYVNFGVPGVCAGFLVLGAVLTLLDAAARRRLEMGDGAGFALRFVVGAAFLQVGGSLVELAGTAAAAAIVVPVINRLHHDLWHRDPGIGEPQPTPRPRSSVSA